MQEEERLITTGFREEDEDAEQSLRPRTLAEYFGQDKLKKSLSVYMQAALNVTESGRQPQTAAAVARAQRMREEAEAAARAEAEAAEAAAKAEEENNEPDIELVDTLPGAKEGYGFGEENGEPEATATAAPEATATAAPEATLPPSKP